MKFFRRHFIYVQVFPDHFTGRVLGDKRTVRRACHSLDNRRAEIKDFSRIRDPLRSMFKELSPGFSLRRPVALMHFVPSHYVPTQAELEGFKKTAERAGVSFCWMSKWETPHTDSELELVWQAL
ncbi:hypothetical protein LF41_1144 [Lysobacter dokdonensis DS-58]|uniref:Uncharacterized protein n=1 Tax=Lysobacter dokdonensis DS-58 TaxID=1300345 RepID=A0A0A2WPE2_9GAMM|nr:hypothetical protein [Lysobacter dokdonensis]KGQ20607.1 hypothetical protein LF41_1144 [Lysobacter dokdonensis DS-58]